MALNCLEPQHRRSGLLGVEKATLAYTLLTSVLIAFLWSGMNHPEALLQGRALVAAGIAFTCGLYRFAPCRATLLLRHI